MIVEITNYFALPGKVEEVLEHRRRGSWLRETLGLSPGKIFVKLSGEGPDVRWECTYASQVAFERDMATRALSSEFAEQRKHMGTLTSKFERHVQMFVEDDEADAGIGLAVPSAGVRDGQSPLPR